MQLMENKKNKRICTFLSFYKKIKGLFFSPPSDSVTDFLNAIGYLLCVIRYFSSGPNRIIGRFRHTMCYLEFHFNRSQSRPFFLVYNGGEVISLYDSLRFSRML